MASNSNLTSKNRSLSEFRRRNKILREFEDTNENKGTLVVSQAPNKKVLGDRNCSDAQLSNLSKTLLKANTQNGKLLANSNEKNQSFGKINPLSDSSPSVEYDPVTNYTSPRPAFLRYNPNRRKEILARMKECEEESLSDENLLSSSSVSSKSKEEEKRSEDEVEYEEEGYSSHYEELEVDDGKFWCSKNVCKWFFPFVILLVLNYYLLSTSKPLHEKNSSINNFRRRGSGYNLKTHMGVGDVCFHAGNEMCDLVISDAVNDSNTWINDEHNKELSSVDGDESKEELSPFQEMCDLVIPDVVNDSDTWIIDENNKELSPFQVNTVGSGNFNSGRYNIGIHTGVIHKCFNVPREMCDLAASDVFTSNDFISLDDHDTTFKKSIESMHESTDIDQKLASDNQNDVAMSADEFLIHEVSNESEETEKEVDMVYESDKDEGFDNLESNSYGISNKFGLFAIQEAVNMKLILFSGCILSGMLTLWIILSMYFSKSTKILKDSDVTPLSFDHSKDEQKESFRLPCSESVEENDSIETKKEGKKDSNLFNQSFSTSPKGENVEFCASRPPAVELLCEFSIVDDLKCCSRTKKMKGSENSELSKSQEKENSQFSRPRNSVKTAWNSLPLNSGKANEKQLKKEMINLATPTPLRRSSRLQNRVTPPYLQN